ncbi:MAG: cobalamin biosynthesis protein CobD [Eubacterium sp.]|nr:cobalamin biosynthesis protein CobD [Eubacterium sp.]
MLLHHIIAFLIGYVLDLVVGDPAGFPHPVKLIGMLIDKLDHKFMDWRMSAKTSIRDTEQEVREGIYLCVIVILSTAVTVALLVIFSYKLHPVFGIFVEAILTCYSLAARSLHYESTKVYTKLKNGTLKDARTAVSMIVGRDTDVLDHEGVARATVETIAENTSDGVIAPMFYTALGGPVLGFIYKAINTMDSMVGYHNDRYEFFGSAAAKVDDIANYIPARISAWFMIGACYAAGKEYDQIEALRIFRRDSLKTKSPNAGQTESVCAGALGIQLGGDASYFGKMVKKPLIGDDKRKIQYDDIKRACRLMYLTEAILVILSFLIMWILNLIMH